MRVSMFDAGSGGSSEEIERATFSLMLCTFGDDIAPPVTASHRDRAAWLQRGLKELMESVVPPGEWSENEERTFAEYLAAVRESDPRGG